MRKSSNIIPMNIIIEDEDNYNQVLINKDINIA